MGLPLSERRDALRSLIKPSPIICVSEVGTSAATVLDFVTSHGLEGVVAKRAGGKYLSGRSSGLWVKYKTNHSEEFVVGGYVPSHLGIDSLIVGHYDGAKLMYAGRVRAGFVPASRRRVFEAINHLKTVTCPFSNLPDKGSGRWGDGLTAEKMKKCVWLKPEAVAEIQFREWTPGNRLRHTIFIRLRPDKSAHTICRANQSSRS
jgi:bifunctional non-homologous end joining protein LigD